MPTVVTKTIGTGGDYPTIASWESATQGNLVTADQVQIGELLNQAHEIDMGTTVIAGSTTDATRYRMLRNATGVTRFRPFSLDGPVVYAAMSSGSINESAILVQENYFRMQGFGVVIENHKDADSGDKIGIAVDNAGEVSANGVFVKMAEGGIPGDSISMSCFRVGASAVTVNVRFFNCIAQGGRYRNGGQTGFIFDAFSLGGGVWNSWAHGFVRSVGRGFLSLPTTNRPSCVNNIATDCQSLCFSGLWSAFSNNISSDYTAAADVLGDGGDPNSVTAIGASSLGLKPLASDFRNKISSPALNGGTDVSTVMNSALGKVEDALGNPRIGTWDIGPYDGHTDPVSTLITEVVETIGPGGDYTDLDDWLAATQKNCYYEAKRYIGLLKDDGVFFATDTYRVRRAVSTSVAYRELRPELTQFRYQPRTGLGSKINGNGGNDTGNTMTLDVREDFFRMQGFGVEQTSTSSQDRQCVRVTGHDYRIDGVMALFTTGTGSDSACWTVLGSNGIIFNSVAKGSGIGSTGAARGFIVAESISVGIYNCIADRIKGGLGYGFHQSANNTSLRIANCIGSNNTADFAHVAGANKEVVQSNNISTDATAVGPGSIPNQTPLDVMLAAGVNDFRLVSTSPAVNAGLNLSAFFGNDFNGTARFAPFDIGIYEGYASAPLLARKRLRYQAAHRLCTLYELVRTDGFSVFLTDANAQIPHAGQNYSPMGSVAASALRKETGLREVSQQVLGAVESSLITAEDLAAGRYRGATMVVKVIDHRFPFAAPIETDVLRVGDIQWDGSTWEAELRGLSQRLEQYAGESIGPLCPLTLGLVGDGKCNADISQEIESSTAVTTVVDNRRTFQASSIPGTRADDYFGYGEFVFLTGNNAGIEGRVKSYTQSTREIKLENKMPFAIQVGDTFRMKPGCRRRYIEDCVGKFGNGANHGGEPFAPGTDKALQTPTR